MNALNTISSLVYKNKPKGLPTTTFPTMAVTDGLSVSAASVSGNNVVLVYLDQGAANNPNVAVFTSSNLGNSFIKGTQNLMCKQGGVAMSGSRVVILAQLPNSGYNYWLSTNSGSTFTVTSSTTNDAIGDARGNFNMDGARVVRGDYYGNIYYSSDYGANWSQGKITATNTSYGAWMAVKISGAYAIACYFLNNSSTWGLYYSSNYGQSWTRSATASTQIVGFYDCAIQGQYAVACNYYGGIWYSSNYGVTWTKSASYPTQSFSAICLSGSIAYAATEGSGYYYSTNYGSTWTFVNNGTINNVTSILISGNYLFASNWGGSYWYGVKPF